MTTITKKHRSLLTVSTFALLLAVGVSGCAKSEDPTVATANPDGAKASAGPEMNSNRSPLKFSQCMRDQGLSWYPDPDAQGNLRVSVPEDADQSKVDKAQEACKAYAPWEGQQAGPISEEDLAKIRQVSQCMRDKGFEKYPDPDAKGGVSIDSKVLGVEPSDPAFQRAREECNKYMPAPKDRENS